MTIFTLLMGLLAGQASAYQEVIEVNRSTATVGGVVCTTGTAIRVDVAPNLAYGLMGSGENRSGIRIQNQDSADSVFIGFSAQVSTLPAAANITPAHIAHLGEQLAGGSPGQSAPFAFGKGIQVWCRAADAAGVAGAAISVMQQGYK